MTTLSEIEEEIRLLKIRNKRVEEDKQWETSWTRKVLLIIFTYLTIGLYLQSIHIPDAWLSAVVPALAFCFSTLTLPYFKKIWLKYINKLKDSQ